MGRSDAEVAKLEQSGTLSRVTPITAPIGGTIIARKVGPGQFIKADSGSEAQARLSFSLRSDGSVAFMAFRCCCDSHRVT